MKINLGREKRAIFEPFATEEELAKVIPDDTFCVIDACQAECAEITVKEPRGAVIEKQKEGDNILVRKDDSKEVGR